MNKQEYAYCQKWAKKIKAINLLGGKCKKCGEDNIFCLDFHHTGEKTENVSNLLCKRWSIIKKEIQNYCILCSNCHLVTHTDIEKFNNFKNDINNRVNHMKEQQKSISRETVKKMIGEGISQVDIANKIGCTDSTINNIVSTLGLKIKKTSRVIKHICENCGKEFEDYTSKRSKFCSRKCFFESKSSLK